MNNQKSDTKSGDHEDGDHYQPINLVSARTAVPVTTVPASDTTVSTQSLAMRTQMDTKPGLMYVYFLPSPGTQVSSTLSSQISMNNQKSDTKSGDHEDGNHYQPINLVAARTAVPVTTVSASDTTVSTQSLAMRTQMDTKPGLMYVYFPPSPGTQVSSTLRSKI